MKKWLAPICACLVLGLVAVGCGGDDDDSGGSAATTEQTATTEKAGGSTTPKVGEKTATADIVDIDYKPRDIKIAKGTKLTWTNTGDLPHTVTKENGPGPDFDSGTVSPGDTFEQKFDTPGKIAYHCTIHSNQNGTITVQ